MATDYALNLKATLDASEVQQKLQQLGQTGANVNTQIEQSVQKLDKSIKDLNQSLTKSAQQQTAFGNALMSLTRGAGAALLGRTIQSGARYAEATGDKASASVLGFGGAALKGAGAGAAIGSIIPALGTTVGAGVGAAAGLAAEALDRLTKSAEEAASKLDAYIAAREQVEARAREAALDQRISGFQNAKTTSLYARRDFLYSTLGKYREQIAGIGESDAAQNNPEKVAEFIKSIDELTHQHQKEIDAINAELESRGEGKNAREDLNEAIAEEARLLKEAAKRESDAWNKAAEAANAEVKAQEELEAKQKAAGDAAMKKAQADFEAAQRGDEATASGASGLLGTIEAARASDQFDNFLKTANVSELLEMKKQMKDASEQLSQSAYYKASQAQSIGGAEGATLLAEAQDEWGRAREAQSRLDVIESALGANLPSVQDSMRALGSEAQKGYDVGGYGNLDQQMLRIEQETKDISKESSSTLRSINTKLEEVKNVITSSGNSATWE